MLYRLRGTAEPEPLDGPPPAPGPLVPADDEPALRGAGSHRAARPSIQPRTSQLAEARGAGRFGCVAAASSDTRGIVAAWTAKPGP